MNVKFDINFKEAVTGHRCDKMFGFDISVEEYNGIRAFLQLIIKTSLEKYEKVTAISGMALGADQIWAQEALKAGIRLDAYVPFDGQDRIWRPESQLLYAEILEKATNTRIIVPGKVTEKFEVTKALMKRNEEMVNDCNLLLAIYNGDRFGGTYQCLLYAEKQNKKVIRYDPFTKKIYNCYKVSDGDTVVSKKVQAHRDYLIKKMLWDACVERKELDSKYALFCKAEAENALVVYEATEE